MRFSLTTLLLSTMIVGMGVGCYVDHNTCRTTDRFHELCTAVTRTEYEPRLSGVAALREHGGVAVLPPLIFALGDPDPTIAISARDALESLTGKSFRSGTTNPSDKSKTLDEMNKEWRSWLEWYSEKHHNADFKAPYLFTMHVQNSLQVTASEQK